MPMALRAQLWPTWLWLAVSMYGLAYSTLWTWTWTSTETERACRPRYVAALEHAEDHSISEESIAGHVSAASH